MALEMKVYREVRAYEARVMFGLSWRQLAALIVGIVVAGSAFAAISYGLHEGGATWEDATNVAMWVIFPILIPVAAWGWWRPKGLKPEQFFGYLIRHYLTGKVLTYDDTYRPAGHAGTRTAEGQPVPEPNDAAQPTRSARRAARRQARRRRSVVPREHLRTAREDRAEARRAARTTRRPGRH